MLDQNTDRMWYVIGAVIVGAAIIFLLNTSVPSVFASVTDIFQDKTEEVTSEVAGIAPMKINANLMPNSGGQALHNVNRYYQSRVVEEDGKMAIEYTNIDNIIQLYSDDVFLEDGETYTMSFYAKADNPISLGGNIFINVSNSEDYIVNGKKVSATVISTSWVRYSFTFEARGNKSVFWHMYPKMNHKDGTRDSFYLTEWKLEKGDTLTPWIL